MKTSVSIRGLTVAIENPKGSVRSGVGLRGSWQSTLRHDYGDLSGLDKDEARAKWGADQVHIWRRSYDVNPPGGESLRDTVARALPYYNQRILPRVLGGGRVLVAAHGNSLRSLIMVLDGLSPEGIVGVELETGVPIVYRLKADSTVDSKQVLKP